MEGVTMAAKGYSVSRVTPETYLDNSQKVVQGFRVTITLIEFDEVHELQVPSIDEKIVTAAAEKLLTQRQKLAQLGG